MLSAKNLLRSGCAAALVIWHLGAAAASEATPQSMVDSFHEALLDTMKNARSLGPKGRFAKLDPIVSRVFDMPRITKAAVGGGWNKLSPEEQARLSAAFERFEVAQFADLFDSYQGQRFRILWVKPASGGDVVVTAALEGDGLPAIRFDYTAHRGDDGWKIEDLRYDAWLSVMERRSAELRDVLQYRGIDGLIARLDRRTQAVLDRPENAGISHLADLRPDVRPAYPIPLPLP